MKLLYIPLDERPCNYKYPSLNAQDIEEIEILTPPIELLGQKKKSADIKGIWSFINEKISVIDHIVISLDMLLYGGLIPSRLHNCNYKETEKYFEKIKHLKKRNPTLKIFAFQCIMRSPSYNSSEEEPSYYEEYGNSIHRLAFLQDKLDREGLNNGEENELKNISVPEKILKDYDDRVNFNLEYNLKTLNLVKEGLIDFLVIPQDDSSPFGYTAKSQKEVLKTIAKLEIEDRVRIYPGADEVGCSLVTRSYLNFFDVTLSVFPFYASTFGPELIPLYEDRPMNESLKSHIEVCGLQWSEDSKSADLILAYNTPGKQMEEAMTQFDKDVSYTSYRNLLHFVNRIKFFVDNKKSIGICDSAFSNGGDLELLSYLIKYDLVEELSAYAGWNTNCNSLGTTLSSLVFNHKKDKSTRNKQVYYRIIEDILYQSNIRQEVVLNYLPINNLSYFELKDKEENVSEEIEKQLNDIIKEQNIFKNKKVLINKVSLPWKRMFELDFEMIIR